MSKTLKFLITLVIGFVIFGIIIEMVGLGTISEAFFFFLSWKGLAIFVLTLGSVYFGMVKWRYVLKNITGLSKFKELGRIWFASFCVTYVLTPFAALGGEPVKVYLAKKSYNLDWKKSIASVVIERFLDWTIFLILTIIGIFSLIYFSAFSSGNFILLAALLLLGLFVLLAVFYTKALKKESTLEWLFKILGIKNERFKNSHNNNNIIFEVEKETINFLSLKKAVFWKALGLTAIRHLFFFSRVVLMVYFLAGSISLVRSWAVYGFTNLALIFPTPAGIGSLEATGLLSFKLLGMAMASGTIFAMVTRGADLLISLIGAVFLAKFAFKLTRHKLVGFFDKFNNKM